MKENTELREKARHMLKTRPANLELKTIAAELKVSTGWLSQFSAGRIRNPGVVTICTLIAYLETFKRV